MRDQKKEAQEHGAELAAVANDTTVVPTSQLSHVAPRVGDWIRLDDGDGGPRIEVVASAPFEGWRGTPRVQVESRGSVAIEDIREIRGGECHGKQNPGCHDTSRGWCHHFVLLPDEGCDCGNVAAKAEGR